MCARVFCPTIRKPRTAARHSKVSVHAFDMSWLHLFDHAAIRLGTASVLAQFPLRPVYWPRSVNIHCHSKLQNPGKRHEHAFYRLLRSTILGIVVMVRIFRQAEYHHCATCVLMLYGQTLSQLHSNPPLHNKRADLDHAIFTVPLLLLGFESLLHHFSERCISIDMQAWRIMLMN